MRKKANELDFISQINRNGIGTKPVPETYLKAILENSLMKEEYFELRPLSLTEKTFVAFNFNVFIVKIK